MGLKEWLFNQKPPELRELQPTTRPADIEDSIFGAVIDIPSRDFVGMSAKSPNKRFTIAWSDGGPDQSRTGRYILLDRSRIIAEGKMPRPNDSKVADNGVFIINDWGNSATLNGTFAAFRPDGSNIIKRKFDANLFNNGLSIDGSRAVCQTCNAPGVDSSLLTVFDLSVGKELGAWQAESGWARSYEFSEDGQTVRLAYPDRGSFAYSLDGSFIDRMKWLAAGLLAGDIQTVEALLRETGNAPPPALAEQLLTALDLALASPNSTWPKVRARIWKSRGICLEATAAIAEALAAYNEALALDPKIGVKRKTDQLRKASFD